MRLADLVPERGPYGENRILRLEGEVRLEAHELRTLQERPVPGLLPVYLRWGAGAAELCVDTTGCRQLLPPGGGGQRPDPQADRFRAAVQSIVARGESMGLRPEAFCLEPEDLQFEGPDDSGFAPAESLRIAYLPVRTGRTEPGLPDCPAIAEERRPSPDASLGDIGDPPASPAAKPDPAPPQDMPAGTSPRNGWWPIVLGIGQLVLLLSVRIPFPPGSLLRPFLSPSTALLSVLGACLALDAWLYLSGRIPGTRPSGAPLPGEAPTGRRSFRSGGTGRTGGSGGSGADRGPTDESTVLLSSGDHPTRMAMLSRGEPGTPDEVREQRAFILVDRFLVGRDAGTCDLALAARSVGRIHAAIHRRDGTFFLEDRESRNGTYLDGRRLHPGEEYLLPERCKIRFAGEDFYFSVE